MTALASKPALGQSGRFWAWLPALLLSTLIGTQLTVLHFVLRDPGFALEPDYYRKAVAWDAHRDLERQSLALGWHAELSAEPQARGVRLRAHLTALDGTAVTGASVRLRAFANARAAQLLERSLEESSPGIYEGLLSPARPGLWEVRLEARRGPDTFEQILRLDLPASSTDP